MKHVDIYTDGACKGNPGPGGWGAILVYKSKEREISGGDANTTNNRMELTAAIEALGALKEPCDITLYSDSKYLVDAMTKGWASGWKSRGWKRSGSGKAQNPDLWDKILTLAEYHKINFIWVKGHDGHKYNERCDALAVACAQKYT